MPDDNCCLFSSLSLICLPGQAPSTTVPSLRKVVAKAIEADPSTWSEAVLGRSPSSYVQTILKPESWGGGVELNILAKHFGTEICSVDVQSGRVDRFGEGEGRDTQVFVVYSGIHYDALTFSFAKPAPSSEFPPPNLDFDTTRFPTAGGQADAIMSGALELATTLRKKHAYTDAANFT